MTRTKLLTTTTLLFLLSLSLLWIMPATADNAVKTVYLCGCGPAANCDKLATEPGKAPCGKELIEKPVLKEDADKIYVCACPADCKCGLNQAAPNKCACGKELRAYPKESKFDCVHGMKPGGGCEKPCAKQAATGCDKPCAKQAPGGCDKPCNKQPTAGCDKPCCAKPVAAESNRPCCAKQQADAAK